MFCSGDGLHISTLLTVRSCTIMYCTYMYVFSVNKILFKPNVLLWNFSVTTSLRPQVCFTLAILMISIS